MEISEILPLGGKKPRNLTLKKSTADISDSGFNSHSVLVLGDEDYCKIWDTTSPGTWVPRQNLARSDSSDKTVYKYLLNCEGKSLERYNAVDSKFVAKLAWDNMPPLTEVKGFVETDTGLSFILEGEKFIFFSKEA